MTRVSYEESGHLILLDYGLLLSPNLNEPSI